MRITRLALGTAAALATIAALTLAGHPGAGVARTGSARPAPAAGPAPVAWQVSRRPFGLRFVSDGRAVTAEAGGAIAGPGGRLAYQVGGAPDTDAGAVDHRLTDLVSQHAVPGGTAYRVATDEPGRTATVTVTRTRAGVRVAVTLTPETGVTAVFEALHAPATEQYLGASSAAYVDLRGHIRGWSPGKEGDEAGEYCQNQEQAPAPFYLASDGYGLAVDTTHIGRFAFPGAVPVADGPTCAKTPKPPAGAVNPYPCPVAAGAQADRVQVCVLDDHLTYDVFYGSPATVTSDYFAQTGLPALPPPSELALMKWRDVNADQAQVLADVAEFKDLRIPIGTIWIDNPWERQPPGVTARSNSTSCRGSLTFDPTFFPDPQQMIDTIHAEGVRFGLWVGPLGETSAAGASCAGTGSEVWAQNGWLIPGTDYIDFTNPAARAYYIAQLTKLFKLGVNMTKEDRGEEYRLQDATLAGGSGASRYLEYSKLYQSAVSQALRAANGDDFETLVRAGAPGTAAITHGMWGSDAYESFAGLRAELRYGISEPLGGGDPVWGSDTGGIDPEPPATATNSPTPALFDRWAQFSAISPVFEVGGAGLNATPWEYPAATVDDFRASVILHYELFPYLYGLAQQSARTGVPILRPLGFQYPADGRAFATDQELMVGPDLLAAPVTADRAEADGEAGRATPVAVYLPHGRWVDVFTGRVLTGGRTVTESVGLDRFPLFMRAGSAIGFNARTPAVWSHGWGVDDLTRPGLTGWMYAPGSGGAGQAISASPGTMTAETAGRTVTLTLHGAPARDQILLLTRRVPRRVLVDGRAVRRASSVGALRARSDGWVRAAGVPGGVLIKLSGARNARVVVTLR